jgi:ATP-dependent protease HslVU (ClpYQ) peptidase subunit
MKYTNKHNGHNGDVQFFSIDKLPDNIKKVENCPVALGESHNHAHIVTGDCELYQDEESFYVKTGKGKSFAQHTFESLLTKETYTKEETVEVADHLPKELLPNTIYKIGIHKKYNPYQKIWDRVKD